MYQLVVSALIFLMISACGVKGKPLPPLEPPAIGLGIVKATEQDSQDEDESEEKQKSNSQGEPREGY